MTRFTPIRLRPGEDLRQALQSWFLALDGEAGFVAACVGSLTEASLRLAGHNETSHFKGPFEIVSLSGTLSRDGPHLHIALADAEGRVIGGHLLPGCRVYTTAEIVLGDLAGLAFSRPVDPETGYAELEISPASG